LYGSPRGIMGLGLCRQDDLRKPAGFQYKLPRRGGLVLIIDTFPPFPGVVEGVREDSGAVSVKR